MGLVSVCVSSASDEEIKGAVESVIVLEMVGIVDELASAETGFGSGFGVVMAATCVDSFVWVVFVYKLGWEVDDWEVLFLSWRVSRSSAIRVNLHTLTQLDCDRRKATFELQSLIANH